MAALVLAVHGLAALVMLASRGERDQRPQPPRELAGVWITLDLRDLRAPPLEEPQVQPPPPREVALVQPRPRTAITLPPPAESATTPPDDTSTSPVEPAPRGPVDWYDQRKKVAEDYTGEPETFSPPPKVMRKCEPRVTSFWGKPPEPKEEAPQWDRGTRPPPGSVMMGGTRVGIIGLGIPIGGPKPEPNKHLFDDMMAGKTPESSVPSPHICD